MTQQTLTRLRNLKLTGMADAVQQQLEQASTYEGLPGHHREVSGTTSFAGTVALAAVSGIC